MLSGLTDVPPELTRGLSPDQLVSLASLGPLREVYRPNPSSRARNARLLWAGVAVGLVGLLIAVLAAALPEKRPGDRPKAVMAGTVLAGLFLSACAWRLRQLRRGKGVRVLVFAEGLARVNGPELTACRWDEVEEVQGWLTAYHAEGVRVGRRVILQVKTAKGTLRFDTAREHLESLDLLLQRVSTESARRLLPPLVEATEAGETVAFGPLGVSRQGIHCQDRLIPWAEVEAVSCQDAVRVRRRDAGRLDWWHRRAFQVPNALVFLGLTGHYLKMRQGAG